MYNTVCSGNGHDRSCSDNDTSAERRPGEIRGGDGEISDPCTGWQVRCLIKKYCLRYGVPFSGSDGVGSSEEIGPGRRGEVLTGKEMINTLNEGKFVCRRVKGPAAYL